MRYCFILYILCLSFSLASQCSNNLFENGALLDTLGNGVTASDWAELGDPDIQDHLSGLQTSGWDWYMPVLPSSDSSTWQNLYSGERIYQNINLVEGKVYRISYEYASQPILFLFGDGELVLSEDLQSVVWFDGEVVHRSPLTEEINQWYNDCFLFEAESTKEVQIAFGHDEHGYSAIDNICLEEVASGASLEDINLCIGEEAEIEVDQGDFELEWSTQETSSDITISDPGLYWLERTDNCGTIREEFEVTVDDCGCKLYVPDIFNPDASSLDGSFSLGSNCGLQEYDMQIYDRWGNLVFASSDLDYSWDGYIAGEEAVPGVYYYKLMYKFLDEAKTESGVLSLIR